MCSPQRLFGCRPTVSFSGSGGTGKTHSPTKTFAGLRRIPASGEAASNGVGRSPSGARYPGPQARLLLDWQDADNSAMPHNHSTTPGAAQPPEHPLTFTPLCRQDHTRQVAFTCTIAHLQARETLSSGHPAPTSLPRQLSHFHLPAPHQANPSSGQHSASRSGRRRPGENIPHQATHPSVHQSNVLAVAAFGNFLRDG